MTPSDLILKLVINGALIVVTILIGFWLHRTGRPYHNLLFTFHKLLTIGFMVFLAIVLVNYGKSAGFTSLYSIFLVVAILTLILLLFSGGMMSLDKMHGFMNLVHRISTLAFVVAVIILFYGIYTSK